MVDRVSNDERAVGRSKTVVDGVPGRKTATENRACESAISAIADAPFRSEASFAWAPIGAFISMEFAVNRQGPRAISLHTRPIEHASNQ